MENNNNPILTKENFLKIFDLVKMLKKNIIQVELELKNNGCIVIEVYGTDSDLSSVSCIYYEYQEQNDLSVIANSWGLGDRNHSTCSYNFEKNAIVNLIKEDRIGYIQNHIIYDQFGYQQLWIGDNIYKNRLALLFENAKIIVSGRDPYSPCTYPYSYSKLMKIYEVTDILKNNDIADSLKMKAADGSNMVNISNNILTMYGNMYPITSKDKASLELFNSPKSNSIISVVTINKPKDITIKCIVRYRNLVD